MILNTTRTIIYLATNPQHKPITVWA